MATALLINPSYAVTYGSNEGGLAFPVFPVLSLATLAGAAIQRGHRVAITDLSYRRYDPDLVVRQLRRLRPDVVGITATTPLINQARDLSYLVKEVLPNTLTIAGGAHPTALPRETLRQSALDAVAVGEADFALADLLDRGRVDGVPSVLARSAVPSGQALPAQLIDNLDELPLPAWHLYPTGNDAHISRLTARNRPVATVEFSRGCLYSCDFCGSKNTMGFGYRKKSPERCADELIRLQHLGYREAVLVDDIFTSDVEWAAAVCEAIIRARSPIAWTCTNGIRVDAGSSELYRLMSRAGCYRVYFGLESGSDEVLRAFGKGGRASLGAAREAIRLVRQAGIEPNGFFLVGLSGDTAATVESTIELARSLELDTMKCGICVPFPGTKMFDELYAVDRIRTLDWDAYTVYNDQTPIFEHPTLDQATLKRYFRRFYIEAYFSNPRFVWRRLRTMIKRGEVFWTAWYTLKFASMLWRPRRPLDREPYRFESRWRPLDSIVGQPLERSHPPRARRGGGWEGRDGRVTVTVDVQRSRAARANPDGGQLVVAPWTREDGN